MAIFKHEVMLALQGDLQRTIEAANYAVLQAADSAITLVTDRRKARLRGMVETARLGKRLANAVRVKRPDTLTSGKDLWTFTYVQPSSVHIFEAFEKGATIQAGPGKALAIPIKGSPADRANFGQRRNGETTIQTFKSRGIEMQFVRAKNGRPAMLVAKSARLATGKTGRTRVSNARLTKSGAFARGAASVPLFWLVPETKLEKRLNWQGEFNRSADELLREFAAAFDRELPKYVRQAA